MQDINALKLELASIFAMKDLGVAKQVLDMRITRDMTNQKLILSHSDYVQKVLERFGM